MLSLIVGIGSSCERDTSITLEQANPPKFQLSGSGQLAMLRMQGQKVREYPSIEASIVWEISSDAGRLGGRRLQDLESITYGEIPIGYVQKYPEHGKAPPLVDGQNYGVFFDTVSANGAHVYFTYRKGQLIETDFRGAEISR